MSQRPHQRGYDAFVAGKALDENPYDPVDPSDDFQGHSEWEEGWHDAKGDMVADMKGREQHDE